MTGKSKKFVFMILLILMVAVLAACTFNEASENPFINKDNPGAIGNHTKDDAIKITTSSINNLKAHLDSEIVSETGYFVQFDMDFDADDGTNFMMKFRANLFTYPYYVLDEAGKVVEDENGKPLVDPEKLAIHNEVIKKNDLIIEWFNGHTNRLLIGMYFDGKNQSLNNPGNNLYLNLRGETRRMFKDFGDSVMYQQLVRLITSMDIDKMLADNDTSVEEGSSILGDYLDLAVSDNYKVTINDDVTSTYYDAINLQAITKQVTEMVQGIFGPFGNKIDPLTNHYLGFKFSTLGSADIRTLNADLLFKSEPDMATGEQILCGADIDARGTAFTKNTLISFDTSVEFSYSPRVQSNIKVNQYINMNEYKEFLYGQYEYKGELYVPMMEQNGMDSRMDAVVRTKLTSDVERNDENRIQMEFTDKANGSRLLLGAYYCNERTYLNTTGLQSLYGGIKLTDIGFPRAYIDGPNIAQLLTDLNNLIDDIITDYIDGLIEGTGSSVLFNEILNKMTSGEETISIRVDLELIKIVLRETQEGNPEYSTQDIIDMLSDSMGYNLEEIAFMLGITDAKRMLEKTWFDLTYNVVSSAIRIELSSNAVTETVNALVFRLDLNPVKIGEKVNFPEGFDGWFDGYTELKEVKTISARVAGNVKFTNAAAVDISDLLGAMIGDRSGLNTKYLLPASASLGYELIFDQYVKFDDYPDDVYPGEGWEDQINEMRGRIGFRLNVWLESSGSSKKTPILNAYAKDVAFNTETEEKDLGYVWVDIAATGFTKVKIREDVFLNSLTDYMGGNSAAGEAMALSIPQIVGALLEDSNSLVFLPDVIQLSTSNKTIQKLFGVKAVLLTADIDVGLVPRVTGITSLESEFADYTVGELANMDGDETFSKGVYEKNLHETIAVTFNLNGRSWVEDLRVPYYRLQEPSSDPADFDSVEEFEEAWRRWKEYVESPHNLIVSDGRQFYSPKTNGAFMGVERWYNVKIDRSGGNSLSAVTAKVTGLVSNDLVWEPLEGKPNTISCTYSSGNLSVPAEFHLDFTGDINGLERALYTVTVGPNSIGEVEFKVFITIRNRRIVTEQGVQSDLASVITQNGSSLAPVAATVNIDPYDYILWRGVNEGSFGSSKNPIGDYLAAKQDKRTVTFYFGDGRYERVTAGTTDANGIRWQFDLSDGGMNREQFITAEGGNMIFVHAYFHNQLVALRLAIQPKLFDYVMFDGETEKNVYTVDVLDDRTYTINQFPTVYFKDGTSRRFSFALQWEHPVADNVTLAGAGLIDGVESPFSKYKGNSNVAWIILGNHYNGIGSWFSSIEIEIKVKAPAKNMANKYDYSKVDLITDAAGTTEQKEHFAKDFMVDGGILSGMWIVDGLNPASYLIPGIITAYFEDGTSKRYGLDSIKWATDSGLLLKENDKYRFTKQAGAEVQYYLIKGQISESFKLELIVAVLPVFNAATDKIDFYDMDGNVLSGQLEGQDIITDKGNNTYDYLLDPFHSLYLPNMFRIRSTNENRNIQLPSIAGTTDAYYMQYKQKPQVNLAGGGDTQYEYIKETMHGRFTLLLTLKSIYQKSQVEEILLSNNTGISKEQVANGYPFELFTLDPDTGVVQLGGETTYLQLGAYLKQLFSATTVIVNGKTINNVRPDLSVFDRFDVQETLGGQGMTLTVSFSEIPRLMDVNIVVRSTGVDQITSERVFEDILQPYNADGQESYPSGFALNERVFNINYGTEGISFSSYTWIVSQVVNMQADLLKVGENISFLSKSVILAARNDNSQNLEISLYAYLPDGSRISRTIRVTPTDASSFESAANEKFRITTDSNSVLGNYSVVIINNMYAVRDTIFSADSLIAELPRTIKIGSAQIADVKWIADRQLDANLLSLQFNKPGSEYQQFMLATANVSIGGQSTLKLYIRFMPSKLTSVLPIGEFGDEVGITYNQDDLLSQKKVTILIRPYQVANGVNRYVMPTQYKAKFENDKGEYTFRFNLYYNAEAFNRPLPFDYNGTTYNGVLVSGDSKNKMTFKMDAGYGQLIDVEVLFADQTVTKVDSVASDIAFGVVDKNGIYRIDGLLNDSPDITSKHFVIDPYGKKFLMMSKAQVFIPTEIRINATKPDPYDANVSVVWNEYTVSFAGMTEFELQGTVKKEGLKDQIVSIKVTVLDRTTIQNNIVFQAENNDVFSILPDPNRPQVHVKNPFLFRYLRDMPAVASSIQYATGDRVTNLPIYWDMSDTDIKYEGNNQSSIMVRFRLNDENGQAFVFYVRTDDWQYAVLERKVADQWQAMDPVYFSISEVTNQSDIDEVQVRFEVTDAFTGEKQPREQKFYTYSQAMVGQNIKNLPILYFDEDAIALSKESGRQVSGVFYLGGEDKLKMTVQKSMQETFYFSSKPDIIKATFNYFAQNTNYRSDYVLIDPLNPVYPTEMIASVNWSKEEVKLNILLDDDPFGSIKSEHYLTGGIIMQRGVWVAMLDKDGNIVVSNGIPIKIYYKINILFLDRRPTENLVVAAGQTPPTSMQLISRDSYNRNSYQGMFNPYEDSYDAAISALNSAVRIFGNSKFIENIVWDTEKMWAKSFKYANKVFEVEGRPFQWLKYSVAATQDEGAI